MRVVYIDESGTIGLKRTERYFVIAAIILDDEAALKRIKNLVKKAKVEFGQLKELHTTNLDTAQKQYFMNRLSSKADYRIAYIAIDKNKISKKLYEHKNVTYNFMFGILLKRVLQQCNEDIKIVSDSRTTKVTSADSLCDYIRAKAYGEWNFQFNIEIMQAESHTHHGLQAADFVANTIFARYNFNALHLYSIHKQYYIIREHFPYANFQKPDRL
jgi:hypothetical protein